MNKPVKRQSSYMRMKGLRDLALKELDLYQTLSRQLKENWDKSIERAEKAEARVKELMALNPDGAAILPLKKNTLNFPDTHEQTAEIPHPLVKEYRPIWKADRIVDMPSRRWPWILGVAIGGAALLWMCLR